MSCAAALQFRRSPCPEGFSTQAATELERTAIELPGLLDPGRPKVITWQFHHIDE
jgi:hypothetical protein